MIIELACSLFILLINEGCGFLFQAFCLSWGGISDIEKFRGVLNKAIKRGVLTKKEVRYYKNIIMQLLNKLPNSRKRKKAARLGEVTDVCMFTFSGVIDHTFFTLSFIWRVERRKGMEREA